MGQRLRRTAGSAEDGFSLVELLTVIVILGILAAIALPAFLGQKAKAQRASVLADLRNVSSAQEAHFVDEGAYTVDVAELEAQGFSRSSGVSDLEITVYQHNGSAAYCARAAHDATAATAWFSSVSGNVSETVPDAANCPA